MPALLNNPRLSTPAINGHSLPSELRAVFHPMGFPLEFETNSADVMAAAMVDWERYPPLSERAPVRLRVVVSAGGSETSAAQPTVRFDVDSMYVEHSLDNHAVANLAGGWGEISLSSDRAADLDYVRYHFLEPLAYLLLAPRHFAFAHASCVALDGRAVVLCGEANAGKTCLAFACARRGWAYISGDATHFLHGSGEFTTAGRPFSIRFRESARDLFPELRAWQAVLRPNQRRSIEIDTRHLNITTALRASASHLIFLERTISGKATLEPIPADEVMRRLDEAVFFGGEEIRRKQHATLRHFAQLPALRLRYSDLDDAEAALRALLENQAP